MKLESTRKSFEERKSRPLRAATQLRLVISLYLANHQTAPPASPEGLPWEEARSVKTQAPQLASSSATHTTQHRTWSLLVSSGAHPSVAWGPSSVQSHLPGSRPSTRHRPPAPKRPARGRGLCPQLWAWKTLIPQPCSLTPHWARSKIYENILIISLKWLRNKVILFSFYNTSKKKKFTLAPGPFPKPRAGCSVETLVPFLPLLKHHGPHHGTHDDAQERAQQQQKHPPPRQGSAAEVPRWVVHIV